MHHVWVHFDQNQRIPVACQSRETAAHTAAGNRCLRGEMGSNFPLPYVSARRHVQVLQRSKSFSLELLRVSCPKISDRLNNVIGQLVVEQIGWGHEF